MKPMTPYIPTHYAFDTHEEAQAFCDTVNTGEGCLYVEPIMYDEVNWGVIKNETTEHYGDQLPD